MEQHDLHDFINSAQLDIEREYQRILKRAAEDPGTAGDQGEENWASLLKNWLPSYFHVVTKGRILTETGYASPQIDVLVLHPAYPKILLDKKLYLAGGVAAAFECKTTLKAVHIAEAIQTSVKIKNNLPKSFGTPYKELNSPILYGLLSHSHSWKSENSDPINNIEKMIWQADKKYVNHPIESIDFITVSDLANWESCKTTFIGPKSKFYDKEMAKIYGNQGSSILAYMCSAIGGKYQSEYFSPLGALLSGLFSKLAWTFNDMRGLELYFRKVNLLGTGQGKVRLFPITIFSESIREKILSNQLVSGNVFDEWHIAF